MMQEDLNQIAIDIIKKIHYLTLGTAENNTPWTAPVFYGLSESCVFYFISQMDCLHTRQILKNPTVAFAIFDSTQKEGATVNGVQGFGKVQLVPETELTEAFRWYHTDYIEMKKESFTGNAPYRFFKLKPEHMYILDPEASVDKRVEVYLP